MAWDEMVAEMVILKIECFADRINGVYFEIL